MSFDLSLAALLLGLALGPGTDADFLNGGPLRTLEGFPADGLGSEGVEGVEEDEGVGFDGTANEEDDEDRDEDDRTGADEQTKTPAESGGEDEDDEDKDDGGCDDDDDDDDGPAPEARHNFAVAAARFLKDEGSVGEREYTGSNKAGVKVVLVHVKEVFGLSRKEGFRIPPLITTVEGPTMNR